MIINAWYLDKQVMLGVADGALVFDGTAWVTPSQAKYVALNKVFTVTANVQGDYEIQENPVRPSPPECGDPPLPPQAVRQNYFLCKVISVEDGDLPDDVITAEDPTGGECLCGLTCTGTEILDVNVYIVNT